MIAEQAILQLSTYRRHRNTGNHGLPQNNALRPTANGISGSETTGQNGFRIVHLRDIAEITGGLTKGKKRKPGEKTRAVPYLRVANVQRGYLNLSEIKDIDATDAEIENLRLRPGDILFNEGGDRDKLGRGWIWSGEIDCCIHQNHVFRARLHDPADSPKYISYYSNSFGRDYFWDQGKHTTNLASINLTKLGGFPIPLPFPEEQNRIVAEIEKQFTRLDAGIAALRNAQAKLKRYRAAVLKAACEGRLVPTEAELAKSSTANFENGDQLLARILDERRKNWKGRGKYSEPAAAENPDKTLALGWTWATVEQISTQVQYGSSAKTNESSDGVPVLRMGNIQDGKFEFDSLKYLPRSHDEFPELFLSDGDVLFNRTNSAELVGKTAVYKGNPKPCSFASYLIRLRLAKGCIPDFVSYFINSTFGRKWIAEVVSQQVGQANVNGTKLQALAIPLPPLAEQKRIVAEVEHRLSVVEELEAVVSANLKRASRLRQSILQKAFAGQLV